MATLDELGAYLATEMTLVVGTTIFLGSLPPKPDVCLAIRETGGSPPTGGLGTTGIQYEFPSVQIVVRGAPDDYETPRTTAETAYRKLAEIEAESLSSTAYLMAMPLQSPFFLQQDKNDRLLIAFNAAIEKEPS